MLIDAIVLAGGRSSRLSGAPKAQLLYRGETLLSRTVAAAVAAGARRVVIVGDPAVVGATPDAATAPAGRPAVLVTREDPPFGGPAAGIAAGAAALEAASPQAVSDFILVLACDLPEVAQAARSLGDALADHADADGVIAVDPSGHPQPLVAVYETLKLVESIAHHRRTGALDGLPARALVSGLRLVPIVVPAGSTEDVDTWADAARHGIEVPGETVIAAEPPADDDKDRLLAEWRDQLVAELGLTGLEVDIDRVLGLAGVAAHAVVRPAAPLTTFLVGYAAAQAAAAGVAPVEAIEAATKRALQAAEKRAARQAGGDPV